MAEGINEPSNAPPIRLLCDRPDGGCARRQGTVESGGWIGDDQLHAHGSAAERFRAEILILRGFIGDPKPMVAQGQLRDHLSIVSVETEQDFRAKGAVVKINGARSVPHRQHR